MHPSLRYHKSLAPRSRIHLAILWVVVANWRPLLVLEDVGDLCAFGSGYLVTEGKLLASVGEAGIRHANRPTEATLLQLRKSRILQAPAVLPEAVFVVLVV